MGSKGVEVWYLYLIIVYLTATVSNSMSVDVVSVAVTYISVGLLAASRLDKTTKYKLLFTCESIIIWMLLFAFIFVYPNTGFILDNNFGKLLIIISVACMIPTIFEA